MRICIYTETALPMVGGQEYVVDALAREFDQAGHEVVVLAPQPRSSAGRRDDYPYQVVRHPRFVSTWRFVEWYRWALIRLHRRFPFDIVHCHSVHPTGYLAVLARARTGAPVVITSHGGDVKPANQRLERPGARDKHAFALAEADALVSISRFVDKGYRSLLPALGQIHAISNGVDASAFIAPAARPHDLDERLTAGGYFLFLGRLASRKGADGLLKAYALLAPARRPPLVLAGIGEERAALEQQADRLGLRHLVVFPGRVEGQAKNYLLQNAFAVIMPSREWEAFPLVVLEAFAAGRPIIATRIPGLEDLVEPDNTGWLVAPEAPAALAGAMQQAIDDPATVERLGRNARQVAKQYDWHAIARQYLGLFETTAARRRNKPAT